MAKRQHHACLFPGCIGEASNQLGLRVRNQPGPNSMWTHDTAAWLCDEHAAMGLAFTIDVALHANGPKIYSIVSNDGDYIFD